ncbi:hypothetical protein JST97_07525 [bacterium]|nr:hypothetical protein [bacterium]
MKPLNILLAGASLAVLASLPVIGAGSPPSPAEVVRGAAHAEKSADRRGDWLVANDSEATVRTTRGTFRLSKGASIRVNTDKNSVETRGRVFCRVHSKEWLKLSTGKRNVIVKDAEFVFDSAHNGQLRLMDGEVYAERDQRNIFRTAAADWTDERVALDGPDVRKRNRKRTRFTQGEENKGKRIGEDETPTQTASPAYTPTPTPTLTPQVSASPPPPSPSPPPAQGGGSNLAPILGGVAGAGGLAAYLATRGDNNASP